MFDSLGIYTLSSGGAFFSLEHILVFVTHLMGCFDRMTRTFELVYNFVVCPRARKQREDANLIVKRHFLLDILVINVFEIVDHFVIIRVLVCVVFVHLVDSLLKNVSA